MSGINGVLLDFSGGPDSALLGYMLAEYKNKHNNDLQLKFVNWQAMEVDDYLTPRVERIIDWIKSENNNVDIEFEAFKMDRSLIEEGVHHRDISMDRIDEFEDDLINVYTNAVKAEGVYTHNATASNVHMPEALSTELYGDKYVHGWRPERDHATWVDVPVRSEGSLKPFINLFKTDLFDVATHYGIADVLMDITNSCNRACEYTEINYHCENCYNCIERHWAYGRY